MNKFINKSGMRNVIFLLLCIFMAFGAKAQTNEDVYIIGGYNPTISDAFKINDNPRITDTVVAKPVLYYSVNSRPIKTSFDVEPIKPAKMIGEPLTKLYRSYIKLGFGNKSTPLGEVYLNNLRSTNQSFGLYFKHLSSAGKIKNFAFPGYSDNEASIYASQFFRYHTLNATATYLRNVVHYYGFKPSELPIDTLEKDDYKQRFSTIGAEINYFSTYPDSSRINHSLKFKYTNLTDLYETMEDNLYFRGNMFKGVKLLGKNFEKQIIGITAISDINIDNQMNSTFVKTEGTLKFQPYFAADYNILKINAGLNAVFQIKDDAEVKLNPDLKLSLNVANNVFFIFAGYRSDQYRNNLIQISGENPFITTKLPLEFSNKKSELYGGIKGSLSSYLSYNAYVSKSTVENMPLFVNDTLDVLRNKFTFVFDTVKVFNTHTEIAFQKTEKFKLMLVSNFYQYFTAHELEAWHKPNMDVKMIFNYNLKNKIITKVEVFAVNRVFAKTYSPATQPDVIPVALKGTVDVNLGVEYRYSKILSGFVNFNNIGAARYQRWYNYPSYGFNVMAGVTYAL